jgi:hypothetical protein
MAADRKKLAALLEKIGAMRDQWMAQPVTGVPDEYGQRMGQGPEQYPSPQQIVDAASAAGRGATRLPYRMAGAPVDITALGLNAVSGLLGLPTNQAPVGGSDWMIDRAANLGLAYPRTDNAMEAVGDIASGLVNPANAAMRLGSSIERGADYAKYGIAGLGALGRSGGDRGLAEAQAAATRAAGGISPLTATPTAPISVAGKPYVAGPTKAAVKAAKSYMNESGISYNPPQTFKKVIPERASRVAQAYDEMAHAPNDPKVKQAYDAMIDETLNQWKSIKKTGLKVEFIKPGMKDPYEESPRLAIMDVRDNNHLWVYPTTSGFGGSESAHVDISGNPLLRKTGEVIDDLPVTANDIFRIVHDYFGHIKYGHGFRADGEENAWRAHSAMYSPLARKAMTSETRGQNSWVNYGPFGKQNRTASGAETQYAPQKTGLLPDWAIEEGLADDPYPTQEFRAPAAQIAAALTAQKELDERRKRAMQGNQ